MLRRRWPISNIFGTKDHANVMECTFSTHCGSNRIRIGLRLIIIRIRLRASDYCLVAKINSFGAKSKQASCADMVLGSFDLLLVWFSTLVFEHIKFKPMSTSSASGAMRSRLRSAVNSSIQAYAQTLVWRRMDVTRSFTWYFFSTKNPSPARQLLLCVYSRMIRRQKKARWVHCSPCSFGQSPRRQTASLSLAAVRRGDCVRVSSLCN